MPPQPSTSSSSSRPAPYPATAPPKTKASSAAKPPTSSSIAGPGPSTMAASADQTKKLTSAGAWMSGDAELEKTESDHGIIAMVSSSYAKPAPSDEDVALTIVYMLQAKALHTADHELWGSIEGFVDGMVKLGRGGFVKKNSNQEASNKAKALKGKETSAKGVYNLDLTSAEKSVAIEALIDDLLADDASLAFTATSRDVPKGWDTKVKNVLRNQYKDKAGNLPLYYVNQIACGVVFHLLEEDGEEVGVSGESKTNEGRLEAAKDKYNWLDGTIENIVSYFAADADYNTHILEHRETEFQVPDATSNALFPNISGGPAAEWTTFKRHIWYEFLREDCLREAKGRILGSE